MSAKQRILKTALRLLNTQDLKRVTTNVIAQEAGISPGNLYYHYRNKAEIVRDLFNEMVDKEKAIGNACPDYTPQSLENYFADLLQLFWEFRFFKREIVSVIAQDSQMKKAVEQYTEVQIKNIESAVDTYVESGFFKKLTKSERGSLVKNITMILIFWIPFNDIQNKRITKVKFSEGIRLIYDVIAPYRN